MGIMLLIFSLPLFFAPVGRWFKYHLVLINLLYPLMAPFPPAPSYITQADLDDAVKFYSDMNEAQWDDYWWHVEHYGLRQAILAGLEGSHIPMGRHGTERSFQDLGVSWRTAHHFRSHQEVRANITDHDWIAGVSAQIDNENLHILADGDSREGYRWYVGGKNPLVGGDYSRMAVAREIVRRGAGASWIRTPTAVLIPSFRIDD